MIWKTCIPPSHSFIYWRLMHGKMPTHENPHFWGCIIVSVCSFCLKIDETSKHLFLRCPFAMALWNWLGGILNLALDVLGCYFFSVAASFYSAALLLSSSGYLCGCGGAHLALDLVV
jgi:hypothetical protein